MQPTRPEIYQINGYGFLRTINGKKQLTINTRNNAGTFNKTVKECSKTV